MLRIWFALLSAASLMAAEAAKRAEINLEAERAAQVRDIDMESLVQMLGVRRVFVDKLTGGPTAAQMRDLLISSMRESRLFVITENEERADAFLRGAAEDLVYTEIHQTSDGVDARSTVSVGRSRSSGFGTSAGIGDREQSRIDDRRHEAMATVRLVNRDGDVIWSTTQESKGAKFRGSSADVADKVVRKLTEDYERARRLKR